MTLKPHACQARRYFVRKIETLQAVLTVWIDAYTRFGYAKHHYRQFREKGEVPFGLVDFLWSTQMTTPRLRICLSAPKAL